MRLISLVLLLAAVMPVSARKLPRVKRAAQVQVERFDTIVEPRADAVRFSGFDKTNQSNHETFFITNNLGPDSTIIAIELTLTYLDADGNQLHERTETVRCILPPGETRSASLRSWDANHAFHYHLSTPPARRRSSPFSVRSRLRSLVIEIGEL